MKTATIYSLTNPLTCFVFYVGSTTTSIETRLKQGNFTHTYLNLREFGIAPIAEVIEECPIKDRYDVERYWMQQFRAWGFHLENKQGNNTRFFQGYRRYDLDPICKKPNAEKQELRDNIFNWRHLVTTEDRKIAAATITPDVNRYLTGHIKDVAIALKLVSLFTDRINNRRLTSPHTHKY